MAVLERGIYVMRKGMVSIIMCCILFSPLSLVHATNVSKVSSASNRATWLWNPWVLQNDMNRTLEFLVDKQINRLYLQIDQSMAVDDYQYIIDQATAKGIVVYALAGSPNWVEPGGYRELDNMLQWLRQYQSSASPSQQFIGIHLDVEPYLYSGWETNRAQTILLFQTLIWRAKYSALNMQLPLELDIPFWFDEVAYHNIPFKSGTLDEWLIKNVNSVTIMAYRDSATAIIDVVKSEMLYAKKIQKLIVIGLETGESTELESVTFYEEGETFMDEQLNIVTKTYSKARHFNGIAIHHVTSYQSMKK